MNPRSNCPDDFETMRMSFQARAILNVLVQERVTNSHILSAWLGSIGLVVSSRKLSDLLDRMEKEELLRIEQIDQIRVVHLRRFGGEVASGLEAVDWIAQPELPD